MKNEKNTALRSFPAKICRTIFNGEKLLLPALRELGHTVDVCIWDATDVAWQSYDAVVIRCPWNYYEKLPQFIAWLKQLEAQQVHVINDLAPLRWNLNKSYLFELSQAALPVIPTELIPPLISVHCARFSRQCRVQKLSSSRCNRRVHGAPCG